MSYLLDTCIISKLRKVAHQSNIALQQWIVAHEEKDYYISVLTIGEIQYGISKLSSSDGNKKRLLEEWLIAELIPRFRNRILSIDVHTVSIWGTIRGKQQKKGRSYPVIDLLIAASALQHNLILATENIRDFENLDIPLINPCRLK